MLFAMCPPGVLVPNHAIPQPDTPSSHRAFYFLSLPFSHSNALFLCRRSVLWRPNFTPIKPPTTKASAAISNHSIVPPVLLSFDHGRCKYRTATINIFNLNHYTSISETGTAEKTGLPKVGICYRQDRQRLLFNVHLSLSQILNMRHLPGPFGRYFKFLQIITDECGIAQIGPLLDEIIAPRTSSISLMSGERTER